MEDLEFKLVPDSARMVFSECLGGVFLVLFLINEGQALALNKCGSHPLSC